MTLRVDDVYTPNPVTVGPEVSAAEARKLMEAHDIRRLPVVEEDKLVGIVTLLDLMRAAPNLSSHFWELDEGSEEITVAAAMSHPVYSVGRDEGLSVVADMMIEHKIGGVPVVEGDRVVGIVTESDVFRALVRLLEEED